MIAVGNGLASFLFLNGTGHPIRFATRAGPRSLQIIKSRRSGSAFEPDVANVGMQGFFFFCFSNYGKRFPVGAKHP